MYLGGCTEPRFRNIHCLRLEPRHPIIQARYTDWWPGKKTQAHTKSPSPMIQIKDKDNDDDLFPLLDTLNIKSHDEIYTIVEFTKKDR